MLSPRRYWRVRRRVGLLTTCMHCIWEAERTWKVFFSETDLLQMTLVPSIALRTQRLCLLNECQSSLHSCKVQSIIPSTAPPSLLIIATSYSNNDETNQTSFAVNTPSRKVSNTVRLGKRRVRQQHRGVGLQRATTKSCGGTRLGAFSV